MLLRPYGPILSKNLAHALSPLQGLGIQLVHQRRRCRLDWATRRVLSWRLSITMEAAFCVETLEDALARLLEGSDLGHCDALGHVPLSQDNSQRCECDGSGAGTFG
jgi:hypothetical protein